MVKKLRALVEKYWEILIYLFFGGLTTLVSFVIFYLAGTLLSLPAWIANAVSWVISVAFAFVTNKPFVFRSHDWSARILIPELVNFLGCRIGSFLMQEAILAVTVDWLHWHKTLWWLISSVLVVLLNYIGSKLLVFRKK